VNRWDLNRFGTMDFRNSRLPAAAGKVATGCHECGDHPTQLVVDGNCTTGAVFDLTSPDERPRSGPAVVQEVAQ